MLRNWAPKHTLLYFPEVHKTLAKLQTLSQCLSAGDSFSKVKIKALAQSHHLVMKLGLAAGSLPNCSLIEPLSQALRDWEPLPKHNNLARGFGFSTQACTHSGDAICWAPQMQQHRSPVFSKKQGLKLAQSLLPPDNLLLV